MKMTVRLLAALTALVFALASASAPASPEDGGAHSHPQDNSVSGLPATAHNVEAVGNAHLTDVDGGIGDVAALGTHAYVAAYASECWNESPQSPGGGVHIVDFTVPQAPVKVGFISAGSNNYVGEGVHAMHLKTSKFEGDVLLFSTEPCSRSRNAYGGIFLYDITDPLNPKPLVRGFGDRTPKIARMTAHASHSAMMWQAGSKAYAVLQDNEESGYRDVDILDITDPRKPRLIAETGLAYWRGAQDKQAGGLGVMDGSFHHDMMVKRISGHWTMLVSYWDAGWVKLNVDNPAKPRFIDDSTYPTRDPQTRRGSEGNGHQGTWSADGKYIIGTDEDFFAKYTIFFTEAGRFMRAYEWAYGKTFRTTYGRLNGPTVYGGTGCPLVTVIPKPSKVSRGEEATLVVVEGGGCTYADKVTAATQAGYKAVIIAASHQTTEFGVAPVRVDCAETNGSTSIRISVLCINHYDFHALFKTRANYDVLGDQAPALGARGQRFDARGIWDGGWGGVHLLRASSMNEIDQYAIPESLKERYGEAAGALTVHETKTDPRSGVNLAYASWYAGGLRVLKFGSTGIREVGRYIAQGGNTFWGVYPIFQEVAGQKIGEPLLLMSDMNHGLYILRYTGPK